MGREVRYVRVAKSHQASQRKLEFSFLHGTSSETIFRTVILPDLMTTGECTPLPGVAPPGDLERKVQKLLDANQE